MSLNEPDSAVTADSAASEAPSLAIPDRKSYSVKVPIFEGPLDLLLHLIRQNEVEITDIPVAQISAQYLEYLDLMRVLDLDVAGEYLVMSATLALIKSRMLLPPEEGEDDEEGVDPRAELVARLLEYKRYKEVAEELGRRRLLGRDVYAAQGAEVGPVADSDRELSVDVFELMEAFRRVLAEAEGPLEVHHVEAEPVTVRECMLEIMDTLVAVSSIEFTQLFERPGARAATREAIVATFLALLELARLGGLRIYQGVTDEGAPEGVIRLRVNEDDTDPRSWSERLSDQM